MDERGVKGILNDPEINERTYEDTDERNWTDAITQCKEELQKEREEHFSNQIFIGNPVNVEGTLEEVYDRYVAMLKVQDPGIRNFKSKCKKAEMTGKIVDPIFCKVNAILPLARLIPMPGQDVRTKSKLLKRQLFDLKVHTLKENHIYLLNGANYFGISDAESLEIFWRVECDSILGKVKKDLSVYNECCVKGPPGSGKSTLGAILACLKMHEHDVLWVHYHKHDPDIDILILPKDENQSVLYVQDLPIGQLLDLLKTVKADGVIVFDSVTAKPPTCAAKYVLYIASHSSETFLEPKNYASQPELYMATWNEHDLINAWNCLPEISLKLEIKAYERAKREAQKVKNMKSATNPRPVYEKWLQAELELFEKMTSYKRFYYRYHYAGISVRFMFGLLINTDGVRDVIQAEINRLDLASLFDTSHENSPGANNTLVCFMGNYEEDDKECAAYSIVSKHALESIFNKASSRVENYARVLSKCYEFAMKQVKNEPFGGWAFESIITQIVRDRIAEKANKEKRQATKVFFFEFGTEQPYLHSGKAKRQKVVQPGGDLLLDQAIMHCKELTVDLNRDLLDEGVVYLPKRFNQPVFDLVLFRDRVIRIIQCTVGATHTLNVTELVEFLKRVQELYKYHFQKLEICFVTPPGHECRIEVKGHDYYAKLIGKDLKLKTLANKKWPETTDKTPYYMYHFSPEQHNLEHIRKRD